MNEGGTNTTQGETIGPEQEPREVGAADPAVRDPRPGGPMDQPVDEDAANEEHAARPDRLYGQEEGPSAEGGRPSDD